MANNQNIKITCSDPNIKGLIHMIKSYTIDYNGIELCKYDHDLEMQKKILLGHLPIKIENSEKYYFNRKQRRQKKIFEDMY